MSWNHLRDGVRRLFGAGLHRPDKAALDADAELDAVIEERTAYLMSLGRNRADAHAEAIRHLGTPVDRAREMLHASAHHREERLMWSERLSEALTDLKFSARSLMRSPTLAVATIVTLALAIGANTAIYSAVRAVLLRPLPYADPNRLVALWETNTDFKWTRAQSAPANMFDWRDRVKEFADIGAYVDFVIQATLTGHGDPKIVSTVQVTGNFFNVLGVRAQRGRDLKDEETWQGTPPAVMLTARGWRNQFNADPDLIGKSILLDGQPIEVAGVLPDDFVLPGFDVDYFTTINWAPANKTQVFFRRAHMVRPIARLRPGATIEQANASLQTVVRALQTEYPATNRIMGAGLGPLHADMVGETRQPLLVMFAAVTLLLLIACANIANLLVVRASGREREAALRLALGAGRGHLVRRALSESLVLASAGGTLGLLLGWAGTRALAAMQPDGMLPMRDVSVSWNVLFFVALATIGSALIFGAGPALWAARRTPGDVLKDESRSASRSRTAAKVGNALLVGQVALALTLTLGAGLLVRSYAALARQEYGFGGGGVLTAKLSIPRSRYDSATKVMNFFGEFERRVATLPGVKAAAFASKVPITEPSWTSQFSAEGRDLAHPDDQVLHREQTSGYQQVMGTRLIEGRLLNADDNLTSAPAVLVNEALVKKFFRGESPLGTRICFDRIPNPQSVWRTVVGVISDERQISLAEDPQPEIFEPVAQQLRRNLVLVVRTDGDPALLVGPIRRTLAELDPALALSGVRTMDEVRSAALARARFITTLLIGFSCVGLVLAIVGVYGVVAQLAKQRTREIGIRLALGAEQRAVQWLMVRHGLGLAALGVVAGIVLTRLTSSAIASLLYQVTPGDLITFVVVPLSLLGTAAIACWVPANHAARTDLTEVMRAD